MARPTTACHPGGNRGDRNVETDLTRRGRTGCRYRAARRDHSRFRGAVPRTAGAAPPGTISASSLAISPSISLSAFDDLSYALAGEILEIAGLENLQDAVPDVLGEAAVDPVLERGSEVVRRLIDVFGGGQDFLSRHFAVLAHRFELVGDAASSAPDRWSQSRSCCAPHRTLWTSARADVSRSTATRCDPLATDCGGGGDERPQCA